MLIALIGNQNTGKTTLFNALTGGRRKVGNFPGVTVDACYGNMDKHQIVDLPGLYSLTSPIGEEEVSRDFIFNLKPDLILNIVDATNLNRNLYLTLQLIESGHSVVIAVNMMDEIEKTGGKLNLEELSKKLKVPVIGISASGGRGIKELKAAMTVGAKNGFQSFDNLYSAKVYSLAKRIAKSQNTSIKNAILFLEGVQNPAVSKPTAFDIDDTVSAIVDMRYVAIDDIMKTVLVKSGNNILKLRTEKIDKILTNRFFGIPIFIAIMGLIFYLSFGLIGKIFSNAAASLFEIFSNSIASWLAGLSVAKPMVSLVVDGMINGVFSVLSFLPMIITLFFFLSVIEDTGYLSRVAFVMDGLLRKLGLNGKAIVPLLLGFGCSVPAYMAIKTLQTERERRFAGALIPFISCSAKIPVYAIISVVVSPTHPTLVMLFIYVLSIVLGIFSALLLKNTVFKKNDSPFVLELPPYRFPSLKAVLIYLWEKAKGFILKAFSIILLASIAIWFFRSFNTSFQYIENVEASMLGHFASFVAPIFKPLGFGNWQAATAIISGFVAKEAVISTLVISAPNGLGSILNPMQALSFLVFCSLYMPCVAGFAALKKETNSKFAFISFFSQTLFAYIIAMIVHTIGLLAGRLS